MRKRISRPDYEQVEQALANWAAVREDVYGFVFGELFSKAGSVDNFHGPARDYRTELDPPDSILGSPFSLFMWAMLHWIRKRNKPAETFKINMVEFIVYFDSSPAFHRYSWGVKQLAGE